MKEKSAATGDETEPERGELKIMSVGQCEQSKLTRAATESQEHPHKIRSIEQSASMFRTDLRNRKTERRNGSQRLKKAVEVGRRR